MSRLFNMVIIGLSGFLLGQTPALGARDVVQFQLANGLKVVLSPDPQAPTVAVAVSYATGAKDEAAGQAGLAHVVEYMMFEGSENLGPFRYLQCSGGVGGMADSQCYADRTTFFEEVPTGALEQVLWAEADRMRAPLFSPESFERMRILVQGELLRQQGQPYAPAELKLNALARGNAAYGHGAGGKIEDLTTLKLSDVQSFWTRHYAPGNAVLAVAGDFDAAQVRGLIEKYFSLIPSRAVEKTPELAQTPPAGAKREQVRDPLALSPMVLLAYPAPAPRSAKWYAANLLATGMNLPSSPLMNALLNLGDVASDLKVSTDLDTLKGASLLKIVMQLAAQAEAARALSSLDDHLNKLRQKGLDAKELARAKSHLRLGLAGALSSQLGWAQGLAEYELFWGDPRNLEKEIDRYEQVTLADVARVAVSLLDPQGRTIVDVATAETPAAPAQPVRRVP